MFHVCRLWRIHVDVRREVPTKVIGIAANLLAVIQFGAPLSLMKNVLQTKNTASLPSPDTRYIANIALGIELQFIRFAYSIRC